MSTDRLPPRPNLEFYKKQAKALRKSFAAGDPDATARVQASHPRRKGPEFTLTDAQHVVARELGFESWPRLRKHIEVITGPVSPRKRLLSTDLAYNQERAEALLELLKDALPTALETVRTLHPRYAGASDSALRAAELTTDDARLIYARDHGFDSWPDFAQHVEAVREGRGAEPFLSAFEAIQAGDLGALGLAIRNEPSLVNAGGTNGNTLLNLAMSVKQPDAVRLLLDAGADPNRANNRAWSPLHQAGYSNQPEMAQVLLDAGADVGAYARGDGGTPLTMALFWGHREAADVLATRGLLPDNLRVAAGLGNAERIASFFGVDGKLVQAAGAHRGFYRPHSGFPAWTTTDDPQEILDEALVYACKSGRVEVLALLVDRGARVDADPYRGTPLLWAASRNRVDVARWLLDHGADVNQKATFGGPSHGKDLTALHLAAQSGHLPMVRFLVERGADLTIRDALYNGTPQSWAEHFGCTEVEEFLRGPV
ncbi:MAG TPA: ankyrin repeat domain-containing protein [Isosphaeraceae bacterium]|jgi:ankyrin repeat protein|nr:ankyrin repeat domain-containing protein [Isosphaeraceae bacterium]